MSTRPRRFTARPFRLTYRRRNWDPSTAPRFRRFTSREDVRAFLTRLRGRGGPIQARLEIRRDGRWFEIPIAQEVPE